MFKKLTALVIACFAFTGVNHAEDDLPYPSTYSPDPSPTTAIINATILTAAGPRIEGGTILFSNGQIVEVGQNVSVPSDAILIDAQGKWVTPGIIDAHSHLGVFPSPSVPSTRDGNEKTGNNTAGVWAEHSVWPQDPGFDAARAGGVTSLQVLPGSANLFGGRSVVLKNIPSPTVQGMKFPAAPQGLKMACGENPIFQYGSKGRTPFTRMGNMEAFREAWLKAGDYNQKWEKYRQNPKGGSKPAVDLELETLAGVLNGQITPQIHCYRADEMAQMIDLSKEFGFKIGTFHHAVEGYKIADLIAAEGIAVATWAQRWGFKLEAYDGIDANAAILQAAGVNTILHSDSAQLVQRLNVEAAMAMASAKKAGLPVDRETAIRWITANPARAMGIGDRTGTLEKGKMADVVLWSGDPFSIYSLAEKVFVDGILLFDRHDPSKQHQSDLTIGHPQSGR